MRLHEIADENPPSEEPTELQHAYQDTAEIKASVYPALQAKIAKLNRKAARLKVPPITLSIQKEIYKEKKVKDMAYDPEDPTLSKDNQGHNTVKEKYYEVKVEGAAPQVSGYKFMATIQHKDAGNIIRTVPGQENNENIQQFYQAHPDYCDHCKKKRHRIDTFIVKGEDGKLRQIGRNCLADFLGGQDPKQILWYFSLRDLFQRAIGEADEETEKRGRRGEYGASPNRVLTAAAAIIRTYGYVKASQRDETDNREPTSDRVRWVIFNRHIDPQASPSYRREQEALIKVADHPTPEDEELVKKAVEWFNSIPQQEKDKSEFYHNIDVLLKSEAVTPRDVGFLGAIFPSYYRALHAGEEKKAQATKKNEHAGVVGQKLPPTQVVVTRTQNISGMYGTTQMCFMEDAEGRMFVWFNNSKNELEQGQKLTITGTIKKHDDYKGRMQTVLTRVKDMTPPDPNAKPVHDQWGNPLDKNGKPIKKPPAPEMKWDLGVKGE